MAANESPAGARRRLRLALRRLRDESGLTQQQVAKALEWSISKVNRIEVGDVTVSVTDLHALLRLYEMTDDQELARLVEAARNAKKRGWWDDTVFREHGTPAFYQLAQFEAQASLMRIFFPSVFPGLLQTPEYASAIVRYVNDEFSGDARAARVAFRMRRQALILDRADSPQLRFLLDESVLLREIGGLRIFGEQLDHVLALASRPNVLVRIISMTDAALLSMLGGFILLEFSDTDGQGPALYREGFFAGSDSFLEVEADGSGLIEVFGRRYEDAWSAALNEDASRRLLDARRAEVRSRLDRFPD